MFNKKISPSEFVARGKMKLDNVSVPVIIHGTYNSYEPTPVSCTISPDGRQRSLGDISDFDKVEVKAITNEGEDIRIFGLNQVASSYNGSKTIWRAVANYFVKGQLRNFAAPNSEIHCSMFIPFTPLASTQAMYTRSFDGTITMHEKSDRQASNGIHLWGRLN
jgi:hypothetical protein